MREGVSLLYIFVGNLLDFFNNVIGCANRRILLPELLRDVGLLAVLFLVVVRGGEVDQRFHQVIADLIYLVHLLRHPIQIHDIAIVLLKRLRLAFECN